MTISQVVIFIHASKLLANNLETNLNVVSCIKSNSFVCFFCSFNPQDGTVLDLAGL